MCKTLVAVDKFPVIIFNVSIASINGDWKSTALMADPFGLKTNSEISEAEVG